MSTEYRFDSVTDFLFIDEDEFERMIPDLQAWYKLAKRLVDSGLPIAPPKFIWVDDGNSGEVSEVIIKSANNANKD